MNNKNPYHPNPTQAVFTGHPQSVVGGARLVHESAVPPAPESAPEPAIRDQLNQLFNALGGLAKAVDLMGEQLQFVRSLAPETQMKDQTNHPSPHSPLANEIRVAREAIEMRTAQLNRIRAELEF